MSRSSWRKYEDDLVRKFHATHTAKEIAAMLVERTTRAVFHRVETLNLPKKIPATVGQFKTKRWDAKLEAKIGEPIATWLRRRYIDEKATYRELTAELGINTRSLMRLIRLSNIEPIDAREAVSRSIENNPNFLKSFRDASNTTETHRKVALWRQVNWQKFCSQDELDFLSALNIAELFPVPQLAVETFNIDFAFPDSRLAVEFDPRWHNSPRKRPMDAKKDSVLRALGWTVLRLDNRTSTSFNVRKVSHALKDSASTQPR